MEKLRFFIGRDNITNVKLQLKTVDDTDFVDVDDGVVLRAVLKFGSYCLDTDEEEHADFFSLADDETVVSIKGGLIPNLVKGDYTAYLTIYDAVAEDGISWQSFRIQARDWPICPVVEVPA